MRTPAGRREREFSRLCGAVLMVGPAQHLSPFTGAVASSARRELGGGCRHLPRGRVAGGDPVGIGGSSFRVLGALGAVVGERGGCFLERLYGTRLHHHSLPPRCLLEADRGLSGGGLLALCES